MTETEKVNLPNFKVTITRQGIKATAYFKTEEEQQAFLNWMEKNKQNIKDIKASFLKIKENIEGLAL